jgi:hypothetical protein
MRLDFVVSASFESFKENQQAEVIEQSAIGNRQSKISSPGSILTCLSSSGTKRSAFALAQLAARTALK